MEGKIEPDQVMRRMKQRIAAESRQARRHSPAKITTQPRWGLDEINDRGPQAGEIGGFPYNSLKETTWS